MKSQYKLILGVPVDSRSAQIFFDRLPVVSCETQKVEAEMSEEQYLALQNKWLAILLPWLQSQPGFVNFPKANELQKYLTRCENDRRKTS